MLCNLAQYSRVGKCIIDYGGYELRTPMNDQFYETRMSLNYVCSDGIVVTYSIL